jgi:hypothetical protein
MNTPTGMPPQGAPPPDPSSLAAGRRTRRLSTETKSSPKTSEFWIYLAVVAAILISAAVISGDGGSDTDIFTAPKAWLYITILSGAYFIGRGLAKSGSRDPYWDVPSGDGNGQPLTERLKTAAQVITEGDAAVQRSDQQGPPHVQG